VIRGKRRRATPTRKCTTRRSARQGDGGCGGGECGMATARSKRLEGRSGTNTMKGESFSLLKCERFRLGKTSNRWWACHGGAIEHASKVTNVHKEQAQHEGWRHRHALEGKKELAWSDGSPTGLLTCRSFCRTRRARGRRMSCWGRKRGSSLSLLQAHGSLGVDVPVDDVVDRQSRRPRRG
jgi:hypothetical protein